MLSTALELAGFGLLVVAAFLVALPLGLAVLGLTLLGVGYLLDVEASR